MTLQQLRYIVAIDRYRSFASAADALGVTQPTLSGMVGKLEEELDVKIFERSSRRVATTAAGAAIVGQAARVLMEAGRLTEMVSEMKGAVAGEFRLAVGPSIAPYILPDFIRLYMEDYPGVTLSVQEMRPDAMIRALREATLDAGIAATPECMRYRCIQSGFTYICRTIAGAGCRYSTPPRSSTSICG